MTTATATEMSDLSSVDDLYGEVEESRSIIENIMEEPETLADCIRSLCEQTVRAGAIRQHTAIKDHVIRLAFRRRAADSLDELA